MTPYQFDCIWARICTNPDLANTRKTLTLHGLHLLIQIISEETNQPRPPAVLTTHSRETPPMPPTHDAALRPCAMPSLCHYRRATNNSIRLCDWCSNVAQPGRYECKQCREILKGSDYIGEDA